MFTFCPIYVNWHLVCLQLVTYVTHPLLLNYDIKQIEYDMKTMTKISKTQHAQSRVSHVCYWLAVPKRLFSTITDAKAARAPSYSSVVCFISCWWFWHWRSSLTVITAGHRLHFWGRSLACRPRFCQTSKEAWAAPSGGSPACHHVTAIPTLRDQGTSRGPWASLKTGHTHKTHS